MSFTRITNADTKDKGVVGLADTPGLSTTAMQQKFDELANDVCIPKHNGLIDELENTSGASSLGAVVPSGIFADSNVQSILNAIGGGQSALNTKDGASKVGAYVPSGITASTETVQGVLDGLNTKEVTDKAELKSYIDSSVTDITNYVTTTATELRGEVADSNAELKQYKSDLRSTLGASRIGATAPVGITSTADNIQEVLQDVYNACKSAGGDMLKSVYDKQNRGYVDHAEVADKISDISASDIQPKTDARLETTSKDVVGAINELKRASDIFDSTAMFYIDANGHYCVDTLQAQEIIEFRVVNNHLTIKVNV